ncbi:MAG: hypothetical protein RBS80_18295 [Thermoguttaceae bacterium]|nr:hypothetical protein [Thermoguttaceae bacterium]
MPRIFSAVVAVSVAILLVSLVVACLWRQPPAEPPSEDIHSATSIPQSSDTAATLGQPTLAPPRPACCDSPEYGVLYATVEVEVAHPAGQ